MEMLRRFFRDEEGANLVEYALLITFIAVLVIVGVTALGTNINLWFSGMASTVAGWTSGL
ncbi:MAG: Flp family type IVb pilin [Chloroflexota bacterium]